MAKIIQQKPYSKPTIDKIWLPKLQSQQTTEVFKFTWGSIKKLDGIMPT